MSTKILFAHAIERYIRMDSEKMCFIYAKTRWARHEHVPLCAVCVKQTKIELMQKEEETHKKKNNNRSRHWETSTIEGQQHWLKDSYIHTTFLYVQIISHGASGKMMCIQEAASQNTRKTGDVLQVVYIHEYGSRERESVYRITCCELYPSMPE